MLKRPDIGKPFTVFLVIALVVTVVRGYWKSSPATNPDDDLLRQENALPSELSVWWNCPGFFDAPIGFKSCPALEELKAEKAELEQLRQQQQQEEHKKREEKVQQELQREAADYKSRYGSDWTYEHEQMRLKQLEQEYAKQ